MKRYMTVLLLIGTLFLEGQLYGQFRYKLEYSGEVVDFHTGRPYRVSFYLTNPGQGTSNDRLFSFSYRGILDTYSIPAGGQFDRIINSSTQYSGFNRNINPSGSSEIQRYYDFECDSNRLFGRNEGFSNFLSIYRIEQFSSLNNGNGNSVFECEAKSIRITNDADCQGKRIRYGLEYRTPSMNAWDDLLRFGNNNHPFSLRLEDVPRSNSDNSIIIRAKYLPTGEYSDNLTLSILPCTPNIINHVAQDASCGQNNGGFVVTFDETVDQEMQFFLYEGALQIGSTQEFVSGNTYSWPENRGLRPGTYRLEYGIFGGQLESYSTPIVIDTSPPVTFSVVKNADESCSGLNNGRITITAAGGNGSYQYRLNENRPWVSFDSGNNQVVSNLPDGDYQILVRDTQNCVATSAENVTISPGSTIMLNTISSTPVTVNGGSDGTIRFRITGDGPLRYAYRRNGGAEIGPFSASSGFNTINGLPQGNYTIRAINRDGCFRTGNTTVSEPPPLRVSIRINTNISCFNGNDGVLEAVPTGGSTGGTITYQWTKVGDPSFIANSRIIENLSIGTYAVTVSKSGENASSSLALPEPLQIRFTDLAFQPQCFGQTGSILVGVTGGTAPYTIIWTHDNSADVISNDGGTLSKSGLNPGGYTFTITDANGCAVNNFSDPIGIQQPPSEILIQDSGLGVQNPTAIGGTNGAIDITVSGGTLLNGDTYAYQWTKAGDPSFSETTEDISGLTEGDYTLAVRDSNNCFSNRTFELRDPEPLMVNIRIDQNIVCFGDRAELTALATGGVTTSTRGYTYQWYIVEFGVPRALTGETNQSITGLLQGIYEVLVTDIVRVSETSNRESFIEPPEIRLDGSHQNVLCNGGNDGSIDLVAIGGTGELTFAWTKQEDPLFQSTDEDLNNLTAGTYTVEVRDGTGRCRKERSFIIEQPDEPLAITGVTQQNVGIFGQNTGSISLTVTGGTPEYTYQWTTLEDPTFLATTRDLQNITVGNYTVQIRDANADATTANAGCITSDTYEITQPDRLVVSIAVDTPLDCFGFEDGILVANATGGIEDQDYTYRWFEIVDNQDIEITVDPFFAFAENLGDGTYKVVVEDVNGAVTEDTFVLEEPEAIVATLLGKTDVRCFDASTGEIRLGITGGTPLTGDTYYVELFRNGDFYDGDFYPVDAVLLENLPSGSYEVEVQDDNGCSAVSVPDPIEITQPDAPIEITSFEVVNLTGFETQNGEITITASGGTPEYRYEWRVEGATDIIGTESTIDQLAVGIYEVTIVDSNDCLITQAYPITQPDLLLVTIQYPDTGGRISCHGAEDAILESTTTGGVPFDNDTPDPYYQYEWYEVSDPDNILGNEMQLQGIGAGIYRIRVTDANGNITESQAFEVTEPTPIVIEITDQNNVGCFNDNTASIEVAVTGGTPFDNGDYLYTWSNGDSTRDISGLYAGNYWLTVTDRNGCQTTSEVVVITEPYPLAIRQVNRIPPSSPNAMDGRITVDVINGTWPYTFQWFDENNNLLPSTTHILNGTGNGQYFVTVADTNGCRLDQINVDAPFTELAVEVIEINPVLCAGNNTASLRANVSGGVPFSSSSPYLYRWFEEGNPTSIGNQSVLYDLPIGTYYIVIEDAVGNSIQSDTYSIAGPPVELELSLDTDYTNCGDGNDWSVLPTVVGGVPPYTYFWQNGLGTTPELVNVSPGTYTLRVQDARGCIAQRSVTTPSLIPLEAEIFEQDPLCYQGNNGTIRVTPTGGVPPYTYLWNTGGTNSEIQSIPAGDYQVEITDSKGCSITRATTLIDPDEIILDIGPTSTILCLGQTYTVDASVDDPNASYRWTSDQGFESTNPEVILSEEANYQVEITTAQGCVARASVAIIVRDLPLVAEFLLSSDVFINTNFVLANVSYPTPDRIDWILPDEAQVVDINDTYVEIRFDEVGEHEIRMIAYLDGCTATYTETIVVRESSSLTEEGLGNFLKNFTAYPIPNRGNFTVDLAFREATPITFALYGITTNTSVANSEYTDEGASEYLVPMNLEGQNIPPGVYFLILEIPGKRYVHKIIIE